MSPLMYQWTSLFVCVEDRGVKIASEEEPERNIFHEMSNCTYAKNEQTKIVKNLNLKIQIGVFPTFFNAIPLK
eukprot:TRINITY_DN1676_c0_g1_i1.p1 TRINITY_DN1676_c0_g1~~TRINITY_DN1676_c0_g1_i1.p1  ORF type:complete len:73 (+),score=12.06 TRINITY_DN1676_c0_g1_i1:60-278(+)